MTARIVTVEEARRIVNDAEQALADPHAPHRFEIVDREKELWACNPDATRGQIAQALAYWVDAETAERKARAESAAAYMEQIRVRALCRRCGARPGARRILRGPSGLREQVSHGFGVTVVLCPTCYEGVAYGRGRAAYEAEQASYDALNARIDSGDHTGLC